MRQVPVYFCDGHVTLMKTSCLQSKNSEIETMQWQC